MHDVDNPLVSVITPMYNCQDYIGQTIASVSKQTWPHWEMLIVDDGSTDAGVAVVNEYMKNEPGIRLFSLPANTGAYAARNKAIEHARGRYFAFLDSDDLWLPEFLEYSLNFLTRNNLAMCFSSYDMITEDGTTVIDQVIVPDETTYTDMLKLNTIGCSTCIYDTEQVGKVFFRNLPMHEDHACWLEILKKTGRAVGIKKILSLYRIRANSLSRNRFKAMQARWRVLREVENLGLLKASGYFCHYAYLGEQKNRAVLKRELKTKLTSWARRLLSRQAM